MNMTKTSLMAIATCAAMATTPLLMITPAWAQGGEELPKIEELSDAQQELLGKKLEAGRKHYEEGQFAKALDSFEQAYRLFPHPNVLYRVAECQEKLGRNQEAAVNYRKFLDQTPNASDRKRILGVIALLEERAKEQATAKLVIKSDPEGATLSIDGESRGKTPIELETGGGEVTVTLELEGYEPFEEKVTLEKGKTVELRYPLKKKVDPGPVVVEPTPKRSPAAFIFTGLGGVALIGSGVAFGASRSANSQVVSYDNQKSEIERPNDYNDLVLRRNRLTTAALAGTGVAVVSFGIASYFFLRDGKSEPPSEANLQFAPTFAPGEAGAMLHWRF
jgi:tetratricopeptide (TPR) repeat protein